MVSQISLYLCFAADRIVVENYPEAPDVKRQFCPTLGQQDRWLAEGMSITQLVKDVWVRGGYLCDNDLRLLNLSLDILKDHSRPSLLVYSEHFESGGLRLLLKHFAVERIIRLGELHYNKGSRSLSD